METYPNSNHPESKAIDYQKNDQTMVFGCDVAKIPQLYLEVYEF